MRYISIFFAILLIWVAVIAISFTNHSADEIFQLYLVAMGSTLALFMIGFGKK